MKKRGSEVYRKAVFLADTLRKRIVEGEYGPGDRLPTWDQLVLEHGISKVTVQRALQQLIDEGFLTARVGQGTFVLGSSPHLTRYALLFPQGEERACRNQLWAAMAREAQGFHRERIIELHYGFDGHQGIERYHKLIADVEHRRLAGLIFAFPPYLLTNTPLVDHMGIPRAALMTPSPDFVIPLVEFDTGHLLTTLAASLAGKRVCRVALLFSDQQSPAFVRRVESCLRAKGITLKPEWIQGISNVEPEWGFSLTRLLMAGKVDERPDSLVVLDDNLLPPVSRALASLGINPPRDLALIAHCNFPWPTSSAVPAERIGYCITECLQALMHLIDEQQQGRIPPRRTRLPAYLESGYPRPIHNQEYRERRKSVATQHLRPSVLRDSSTSLPARPLPSGRARQKKAFTLVERVPRRLEE